jgi:DNA-binding PadR family transcriptional regulator
MRLFGYRGCARRRMGTLRWLRGGVGSRRRARGAAFRGRKLGSGDLQLVILALLEEQPRHGYEIIKALEETSKGFYVPSPGMVYPALTYLEEVGYATVEADGSKKLYHITDAGRAKLNEDRAFVDSLMAQLARIGDKMDRVRKAFASEDQADLSHRAVDQARQALRAALIAKLGASPSDEELKRIRGAQRPDELRRGRNNDPLSDPCAIRNGLVACNVNSILRRGMARSAPRKAPQRSKGKSLRAAATRSAWRQARLRDSQRSSSKRFAP